MLFRLDANNINMVLDRTNFDDSPTLLWSTDSLGDADHQLYLSVNSLQPNGSLALDYLEYVLPLLHFVTRILFNSLLLSGLRIRLERASIPSGPGQTP